VPEPSTAVFQSTKEYPERVNALSANAVGMPAFSGAMVPLPSFALKVTVVTTVVTIKV
jgi:hypothetical protein